MKNIILIAHILFANYSMAAESSFADFSKWVDHIVSAKAQTAITLDGYTLADGIPCQLYVTRFGNGEFYLSLGVGPHLDKGITVGNHYFGSFINSKSQLNMKNREIDLNYSGSYVEGNSSYDNVNLDVKVELNTNQFPARASGQSTLQPIRQICILEALIG